MKKINQNKRILIISVIIGFVFTCAFTYISKEYAISTQEKLAEKFIRFHVIANSDSEDDQKLKLAVRDAVLDKMSPILNSSESIEETRELLNRKSKYIEEISEEVIKEWDKDYDVKVSLGMSTFPTKRYGDVVLPAGTYEALRIEIGEAKGKNWWCVMFPPLCFVDVTHGIVPDDVKDDLKNILTEDEYDMVLALRKDSELPVKVKFKIVEWWQEKYNYNTEQIFAENK